MIDRKTFYIAYREVYGKLLQSQVDGYEAILDFWDSRSVLTDLRWLAYIMATAFHETGRRMQPVREGFCPDDPCSVRAVARLYNQGRIKTNYALPHANGHSYFGRGLVQLTWGHNYKKAGQMIGLGDALYDEPRLLLRMDVSVKVMIVGMLVGIFVPGHNLERHFTATKSDWKNARRIVNGLDKWELIQGYALNFYGFLRQAVGGPANQRDVERALRDMEDARRSADGDLLDMSLEELSERTRSASPVSIYDGPDVELGERSADYGDLIAEDPSDVRLLGYDEVHGDAD
ncbi:glycoside hydrolase family 19 protein [Paracoccus sp. SCSIO 75233]|uniref:glycoside hydrolase family 19 protein n=1 Tax=Paracoccus sp. SCSIO 75233 TaxID=3017782 RepID=UPI0022F05322|nr:glycoside hydrolase family 19 protein [Paracoccus sp. SCSIO 75233]WBU53576.1 hypothetical protein PAF12_01685 [Paracoccus sp. SCSIO 75233]